MTTSTFTELGVAEPLRRALEAEGYTEPTPIQTQAIPLLLAGRDMLGLAQTGTGKTAAFALPMLQRLPSATNSGARKSVRALILAPTRELAIQIDDSLRTYGRHLHLRTRSLSAASARGRRSRRWRRGVDILVATPGAPARSRRAGPCAARRRSSHLVLDEADRMLDMGFIRDIRKIVAALPQAAAIDAVLGHHAGRRRTTGRSILHQPVRIDVSPPKRTAENIDQRVYFVDGCREARAARALLKDRRFETRPGLHPHQARRQSRRRTSGQKRLRGGSDPRQQVARRPPARAGTVSFRRRARSGRHRYRGARHRHRQRHPCDQLRAAERAGKLCAPHRPHGARGRRAASRFRSAIRPKTNICARSRS